MAENTRIEWADHTFNPWIGCTKVHAGCTHCYAEADFDKRRHVATWGPAGTRVVTSLANWLKLRVWNRKARMTCVRSRVFCASLADVFEDWRGSMHDSHGDPVVDRDQSSIKMPQARRMLFDLIDETLALDWLLLTKRPQNVSRMWPLPANGRDPGDPLVARRDNVWLLTSVSDQATADAMTPELLKCRELTPVLGLSCEPLLGPIDLTPWLFSPDGFVSTPDRGPVHRLDGGAAIDWVIVGGESGPNARPCNIDWIRSIRDQCRAAGVPVFVKQLGSNVVDANSTSADTFAMDVCWPTGFRQDGQRIILRDKKGGDWSEWPADLRVRELPRVESEATP